MLEETDSNASRGQAKILFKYIYTFSLQVFVIVTKLMKAFMNRISDLQSHL